MVDQLPSIFDQYKSDINAYLKSGLEQKDDPRLNRYKESLYQILTYGMGWTDKLGKPVKISGGKLLRPTLCLFAAEASGGRADKAIKTAIALEYIHNFSLFHDDIQDQDEIRHHRPTVWYVWGEPKAIVAGNVLRSIADVTLTEFLNPNSKEIKLRKLSDPTFRVWISCSMISYSWTGVYQDVPGLQGCSDDGMICPMSSQTLGWHLPSTQAHRSFAERSS